MKGVRVFSASLDFVLLSKFSKMRISHVYNRGKKSEKQKHTTHTLTLFSLRQTEKWTSGPAAI